MTCDCLNDCGDDPGLRDGRAQPCKILLDKQHQDRISELKAAARQVLCQFYGVFNIVDLVEAQATHIERLQAQLTALQSPVQIKPKVRKA